MPIFRINGQLHYYAHVPKTGGSSVKVYLIERFGRMALEETGRHLLPDSQLWSRESTAHIPVFVLDRIFPRDWLVSSFAVVRHPMRRLISAFFYARDVRRLIPLSADFNLWFREAMANPDPFGSHLLPQSDLVPEGSRIFRLEDGLDQVVPYLDTLAGNAAGPRVLPTVNVGKWRGEEAPPVPSEATLELVARVYAADFARFGYTPMTGAAEMAAMPDLPKLGATGAPPAPRKRSLGERVLRKLRTMADQ